MGSEMCIRDRSRNGSSARTKTRATQYRKSCSWERRHGKTRGLKDKDGDIILSRVKICDFYDPYWRVEFSDGDWEELTR